MSALGPLDLSGADTSGGDFEALKPGQYNASIVDVRMEEASGEGKLPAGSPMFNVQFMVNDEPYVNRRVFRRFMLPAGDYDAEKAAKLKGMFVRFLTAVGYDEDEVTSGQWEFDADDMAGRECVVVVSRREYPESSGEFVNDVKGVKPAGSKGGGNGSSGLL